MPTDPNDYSPQAVTERLQNARQAYENAGQQDGVDEANRAIEAINSGADPRATEIGFNQGEGASASFGQEPVTDESGNPLPDIGDPSAFGSGGTPVDLGDPSGFGQGTSDVSLDTSDGSAGNQPADSGDTGSGDTGASDGGQGADGGGDDHSGNGGDDHSGGDGGDHDGDDHSGE